MASIAVVGDSLPIRAGVTAVVAAEATRRIVVAEVVGMNAPKTMHVRENVAEIDCGSLIACLLHQSPPRLVDLRVIRAIKIVEFRGDVLPRYIARRIVYFQNLDRFLSDIGKLRTDVPE